MRNAEINKEILKFKNNFANITTKACRQDALTLRKRTKKVTTHFCCICPIYCPFTYFVFIQNHMQLITVFCVTAILKWSHDYYVWNKFPHTLALAG